MNAFRFVISCFLLQLFGLSAVAQQYLRLSGNARQFVPGIMYLGNNGDPPDAFPLPRCGGDCDRDADCQGGLICYQRDSYESVPGCSGGSSDGGATDYCTIPSSTPNEPSPSDTLTLVGDSKFQVPSLMAFYFLWLVHVG